MNTIREAHEKKIDQLLNDCHVFFAFSNKQFEEGQKKHPADKYCCIGAGGYMPVQYKERLKNGFDEIAVWRKNALKRTKNKMAEIIFELNNYECFYTHDLTPVYSIFSGIFTKSEIDQIFNQELKTVEL